MPKPTRISTLRPWVILFAAALAVRLLAVQLLWAPSEDPRGYEHAEIARNLLDGRGFTVTFLSVDRPTSQQAPFYPFLLAGAYLAFGVDTPQADLAVQVAQCFAGAWLCLAVVRLSRAVAPSYPLTAWFAGWGAALYPPHVYMVTHLQVALWAAVWLTLLAEWTLCEDPRKVLRTGVVGGILGGLLLLTEPILAVALPILALALWRRTWCAERELSPPRMLATALPTAVMTIVTCLMIAPWLVRNYQVHDELVFIKSTFGYAFWQGNNEASFGTDKIPMPDATRRAAEHDGSLREMNRALWAARFETMYIDDLLLTTEDKVEFALHTEPENCRELGRRANEFIRNNPGRYLRLCLNRLQFFLLFDRTNPKALHIVYQASTVAWLALATCGLVVSRKDWRTLWPTYAIFAAVLLFHTITITSSRFRIPVEPLTFPWCGATVAFAVSRVARFFAQPAE